jgi:LCP family protein required for cell wall assembly
VVLVAAVIGYAEYLNSQITRLDVGHLAGAAANGTVNILMVGSTSRCALKQQNPAFGLCNEGVTGVNSDVIMILHLDPNTKKVAILSLPRDLFVPNARTTGANKIDAALFQGPTQLVNAIEEDFGIPIQHYVELNFDTFQGVVNALGGIRMYFPMPLYDAFSSLNVPTAGCETLSGFQALAVVRARHLQYKPPNVTTSNHAYWPYDPESDLSRIRRDHEFIRVLATQVSHQGLGNPLTDRSLVAAVAPDLEVDSGLGTTDMINMVLTFHGTNPASAPEATLPVMVHGGLDYYFQGYDFGSVELPSEPQDTQAIDQLLGIAAGRDTMTGARLPSPGSFSVTVDSGSGVSSRATRTAAALDALGFQATSDGSVLPGGTPSETLVVYQARSAAALADAEAVLHDLSGAVVLAAGTPVGGAPVTVVTGSNFTVTPPAAPTSTSSTGPPTSSALPRTTTTTTTTTANGLSAPTPVTQALAPFDPRSCTASGGEGS